MRKERMVCFWGCNETNISCQALLVDKAKDIEHTHTRMNTRTHTCTQFSTMLYFYRFPIGELPLVLSGMHQPKYLYFFKIVIYSIGFFCRTISYQNANTPTSVGVWTNTDRKTHTLYICLTQACINNGC